MKIGLPFEELERLGFVDFQHASLDILDEIKQESISRSMKWNEAAHEATIRAVAKMIEENNNELLKQLKSLGVL